MRKISDLIHEYEFPYHDYLKSNKDYLIKLFEKDRRKRNLKHQANVPLDVNDPVCVFLYPKLIQIVVENYFVSNYFQPVPLSIYMQTKEDSINVLHNHYDNPGITGVTYLDPPHPQYGGGIKFTLQNINQTIVLHPQPNKLYLFPSWLYHCPLPQTTSTPRISLNWSYVSSTFPIHKISGDRW